MVDFEKMKENRRKWREEWRTRRPSGRAHIWTGIFILLIGVVALLKASLLDVPDWVFSWEMLLIALGLFIGLRHRFRGIAWLIMMLVGGVFLIDEVYPDVEMRRYTWPLVLIIIGLFFILRPKRRWCSETGEKKSTSLADTPIDPVLNPEETYSQEDFIDSTSIFGGAKKNILSKDFKGGDIVNIFGGTELNLTQADIKGVAIIELTTIFGGTKLIIPSNWAIRSEAVTIFGGIEDKRSMPAMSDSPEKVLLLKGTVIFGGIDIKSF